MDEVSRNEGRTVLFVSHNLVAVQTLCKRGFFLECGQKYADGPIEDVINKYTDLYTGLNHGSAEYLPLGEGAIINNYRFLSEGKDIVTGSKLQMGQSLEIEIEVKATQKIKALSIAIDIRNIQGELYSHITDDDGEYVFPELDKGESKWVKIKTSPIFYVPGDYCIDLWLGSYHSAGYYSIRNALQVSLEQSAVVGRKMSLPQHMKFYLSSVWT